MTFEWYESHLFQIDALLDGRTMSTETNKIKEKKNLSTSICTCTKQNAIPFIMVIWHRRRWAYPCSSNHMSVIWYESIYNLFLQWMSVKMEVQRVDFSCWTSSFTFPGLFSKYCPEPLQAFGNHIALRPPQMTRDNPVRRTQYTLFLLLHYTSGLPREALARSQALCRQS